MSLLENNTDKEYFYRPYGRPAAFAPPTEDIALLEVAALKAPEGLIYPEQKAYFCTIAWCQSGSFTIQGRGWSQRVIAGQVCIMDTGVHFSVSAEAEGATAYYLLMDGSGCHELLKNAGLWQGVFPYQEIPLGWLEWIAAGVSDLQRQTSCAHTSYSMFMKVAQQAQELCSVPELWHAQAYLQHNWSDLQANVETLLLEVGISRTKLTGLFKEHLNATPLQYLNSVRLYHARRLLVETQGSIADIACQCGLPDASYFSHWFRKHAGCSPSQLRKTDVGVQG